MDRAETEPAAMLERSLDALLELDPDELDNHVLGDLVVDLQRQTARLAAVRARFTDRWNQRQVWADDGSLSPASRMAKNCGLSKASARRELRRARKLASMPVVRDALAAGEISCDHLDVLAHTHTARVAGLFTEAEKSLVDNATTLEFTDFQAACRYWGWAADDATETSRARRQHDDRHFNLSPTFGGTYAVGGTLDPVGGSEIFDEVDRVYHQLLDADRQAAAGRAPGDLGRSPGQRRADALLEIIRRSRSADANGKRPRPLLSIILGLEGLTNLCESAYGTPIHPSLIVPLLADADIERIVFDGPDRIISVGHQRRFTGALRRAIQVRDRTCRHPAGCDIPAWRCDVDHVTPYEHGGPTTIDNGRLCCARHNRHPDLRDPPPRPPPDTS